MKYTSQQITNVAINFILTLAVLGIFSHSIELLYHGTLSGEYFATFGISIRTLFLTSIGAFIFYKIMAFIWVSKN